LLPVEWSTVRKPVIRTGLIALAVAVAALLIVLRQGGVFAPSVHDRVKSAAKGPLRGWYLGDRFAGLDLTGGAGGKARRIAAFGYGRCRRVGSRWDPFSASTCGYPLLVQTWRLDEGTQLSTDFVPTLADGTCAWTTVRGVPAAVSQDGLVLYTGSEAIGVLGPPELVGRAVRALRPAGGAVPAVLPPPRTQPHATLAQCARARAPFEPLATRVSRLLRTSGLPLVGAGGWFEDGQLTNAEETGKAVSLDYESCRLDADLGNCANVLSVTVEPVNLPVVASDLRGATCRRFTLGGAPGVTWNNQTADGGDAAGLYVFTGGADVATARDFTLEHVGAGKLDRAVTALRPLESHTLPKPTYDAARLLRLCAKTS
jgi:hypothetical protein